MTSDNRLYREGGSRTKILVCRRVQQWSRKHKKWVIGPWNIDGYNKKKEYLKESGDMKLKIKLNFLICFNIVTPLLDDKLCEDTNAMIRYFSSFIT